MVVAAVQTEPMAMPASTTTLGEKERRRHMPRISRIEAVENRNAIMLVA